MNIKKQIQKGFTIVELLVYMALLSIFLTVLLDIFSTTLNQKLSSEATSAISQDSRYFLSKLSYEIENADSVALPVLGTTGPSLQIVTGGITSTYGITAGNLVLTQGGITMKLNGLDTALDNISFKNIGNVGGKPTVQIIYTIHSNITLPGAVQSQTITVTPGLR